MTVTNSSTAPQQVSLTKRMVIGASVGFLLISLFLLSANKPDPAWGRFWMIRPLIIVPLAGAMGGFCNHFITGIQRQVGLHKLVAVVLSVIVFVIGLWMGVVLGLDGTMWD